MNSLESFVKFIPNANSATITLNTPAILTDVEVKARKLVNNLNDSLYENSNEPSLGLFRVQEHVRKTVPSLSKKKTEIDSFTQTVKGSSFDLEYSIEAVNKLKDADPVLESIHNLLNETLKSANNLNAKKSSTPSTNRRTQSVLKSSPSMN
ncbi:unnamed protein product [Brachionus calyciflorus]|uniref:Uncharacterized protein n=1 Tax=Brachionus calyciflorus TaxID=104777 RepID=A0A813WSE3_9BILA|nr:unnamed protein product [Brachionus calyciflorus]